MNKVEEHDVIQVRLEYISKEIEKINKKLDYKYVSKEEFEPVKKVVYGLVATVSAAIVTAILASVLK